MMPAGELIMFYHQCFIFIKWILASDEALELCPLLELRVFRKDLSMNALKIRRLCLLSIYCPLAQISLFAPVIVQC